MARTRNVQIARRFFDAVAAADIATIQSVPSQNAVLMLPGSFSRAGTFEGRDEFLRGVGQLVEASGGTLRVELLDTFVNGLDGDQVIGGTTALERSRMSLSTSTTPPR